MAITDSNVVDLVDSIGIYINYVEWKMCIFWAILINNLKVFFQYSAHTF